MKKRILSLSDRIWITLIASILIVLCVVYYQLHFFYSKELKSSVQKQQTYEDEIRVQSIENYTNSVISCANTIILQMNSAFGEKRLMPDYVRLDTETQKVMYCCLLNTFSMFRDTLEVEVVWNNGKYYHQDSLYTMRSGEQELVEELQSMNISTKGIWVNSLSRSKMIRDTGLFYIKPLLNVSFGEQIGYVILKVDGTSLTDADPALRSLYIFSNDGRLLQSNVEGAVKTDLSISDSDERYRISNGWELVVQYPEESILRTLERTEMMIFSSIILSAALMGLIMYVIIKGFLKPIKKLTVHLLNSKGNLLTPFIPDSFRKDEVGILIDKYNAMVEDNRRLFKQINEERELSQQLELSLLQSQIKPHFLYNSLDTVYCLSVMNKNKEAADMTKLLSDYYRLIINRGMDLVSLKEELRMTTLYLQIQSIRYRNVVSFYVTPEEDAPDVMIPKLTLQPLIENAIYHGLKPKGSAGFVSATASWNQGRIEIRVQDDGVGMDPEEFYRQIHMDRRSDGGFGMKNVAERLRLYYREKAGFEIEKAEQGTSLLIWIQQ